MSAFLELGRESSSLVVVSACLNAGHRPPCGQGGGQGGGQSGGRYPITTQDSRHPSSSPAKSQLDARTEKLTQASVSGLATGAVGRKTAARKISRQVRRSTYDPLNYADVGLNLSARHQNATRRTLSVQRVAWLSPSFTDIKT